ncbi:hypothetical protein [Streptomyces europaeiscabiei]|uniref:hypothetical protein n=1 Tax=Streptomyces europaeiscabiei TaxID=146819 RepID=UPI002E0F4D6A|nr:hypothetical protein OHB30_36950 [Streptomyces europaeiscabiei]
MASARAFDSHGERPLTAAVRATLDDVTAPDAVMYREAALALARTADRRERGHVAALRQLPDITRHARSAQDAVDNPGPSTLSGWLDLLDAGMQRAPPNLPTLTREPLPIPDRRWVPIDAWFADSGHSWADIDRTSPGHNFEYGRPEGKRDERSEDNEHQEHGPGRRG